MCIGVGQGIATIVERLDRATASGRRTASATVQEFRRGCLSKPVVVRTMSTSTGGRRFADHASHDDLPEDEPRMIDQQPTVVSLTDAAVGKLRELTKEETNPDIGLRVYVYSGGCSGLPLRDDARGRPDPRGRVLEASGIKVYVDGQSVDLLQGSQIDYVDTLMGAGFTVNNPNAVAACGCGSSFRTADDAGAPEGLLALTDGSATVAAD